MDDDLTTTMKTIRLFQWLGLFLSCQQTKVEAFQLRTSFVAARVDRSQLNLIPSSNVLRRVQTSIHYPRGRASTVGLFLAKTKSSKKSVGSPSTSGFGGAAIEPCPCGSGVAYHKCCGRLHKDMKAWTAASASEVVRARYTAYALRVVDFIIKSTHPLNEKNFQDDLAHWKQTIETNCYDNFILNKCVILDEQEEDIVATVRFMAQMTHRDTGERTSFVETSTFERDSASGVWLYKDGVVSSANEEPA